MALLKLFISLIPLFLWGAYNYKIEADLNLYSDKLKLNIFEDKWDKIPSYEPLNRAVDFSYISVSTFDNNKNYEFGYRYRSEGYIAVNKGFIETWYYASNDFDTLLKMKDVGYYIDEPEIYGILNYLETDSLFYKIALKGNGSGLFATLNLFRGRSIEYMEVTGFNEEKHFVADIDYYFSDKNFLTSIEDENKDSEGYGLGFDIEFLSLNNQRFNFFAGFYNLGAFIQWKGITRLVYHFDSNTKYVGEDGYYHYRPFGVGRYYFNSSYRQRVPFYGKYKLSYKLYPDFTIGDSAFWNDKGVNFNQLYIKSHNLKLGYVVENKNFVFGVYGKSFQIELSKNLDTNGKYIKLSSEIEF